MSKKQMRDPLYQAAWRACGKPLPGTFGGPDINDLRARLEALLKSGWSMQALEAYASQWQCFRQYKHVTPSCWRLGVHMASIDFCQTGTKFLKDFKSRQEQPTPTPDQAAGMSA